MPVQSRIVSSKQRNTHPKLPVIVRRHLAHDHRRPVADHSRSAFALLLSALDENPQPLVLDSFCGTGLSTARLAERHPDYLIVGVDKSAHRLGKHESNGANNYLLLQADCQDIWQLLLARKIQIGYHYLLYPNPWPKSGHLQRRIHGSAAFPWLLQLGGEIELRSNWQLYVEEFGLAMHLAGHYGSVSQLHKIAPITLFEKKYQASGQNLWVYTGYIGK